MRVMSYNILSLVERNPPWVARRELVANVLRWQHPDIVGFQEATRAMIGDLERLLPQSFRWLGVGRDDGKENGEFNPIFLRRDLFTVADHGNFWLAPSCEAPARAWGAMCRRIVTWARLVENVSGREFYFFNTHFDHFSRHARRESAKLLLSKIQTIGGGNPVLVTGDFNAREGSPTYRIMTGKLNDSALPAGVTPLRDALHESAHPPYGPRRTWRGFLVGAIGSARIDFIFVKNAVRVNQHAVIADADYASDHLPVMADVEVGEKGRGEGERKNGEQREEQAHER